MEPDDPDAGCPVCSYDSRRLLIMRMALSQLDLTTDTGAEKALIAEMLADLAKLNAAETA